MSGWVRNNPQKNSCYTLRAPTRSYKRTDNIQLRQCVPYTCVLPLCACKRPHLRQCLLLRALWALRIKTRSSMGILRYSFIE